MQSADENLKPKVKPLLRGHFHQAAFFFAFGACSMLVAYSHNDQAVLWNLIYSLSLTGLFAASAIYHRPHWNSRARAWMRRVDHAAIFVLIAGTATPIWLLTLPTDASKKLLISVWIAAAAGVLQSLFWIKAPKWLIVILYIGVAWIAVPHLSEIANLLGETNIFLIAAGGGIYILGALIYVFKKPNPWPLVFGYHEIFHIFVIVAAVLHFLVIARLNMSVQ